LITSADEHNGSYVIHQDVDRSGHLPRTVNNAINKQQVGSLTMTVQPWTSTEAAVGENNTVDASYLTLGVETIEAGMLERDSLDTAHDIAIFDPLRPQHRRQLLPPLQP
jgi:hypothetical protein